MCRPPHLVALLVLTACAAFAQPTVQTGSFHTVLASSVLMVAARVVPVDGGLARYALAEARLAEHTLDGLRLVSEGLAVVDCDAKPRQMAMVRQLHNARPAGEPAQWSQVAGPGALPGPLDWAALPFKPVSFASRQMNERLQLPDTWQVVSHFVCTQVEAGTRTLSVPSAVGSMALRWSPVMEQEAAVWASQARRSAGLPDVQTWRCPLTDRVGYRAGELEVAFSPSAGAVRVNDKWLPDGTLDTRYLGFEQDGITFRFMLETGVMRMVRRDEMQSVASARCVLVQPRKTVKSGW